MQHMLLSKHIWFKKSTGTFLVYRTRLVTVLVVDEDNDRLEWSHLRCVAFALHQASMEEQLDALV